MGKMISKETILSELKEHGLSIEQCYNFLRHDASKIEEKKSSNTNQNKGGGSPSPLPITTPRPKEVV